jgi:hypothetical protein
MEIDGEGEGMDGKIDGKIDGTVGSGSWRSWCSSLSSTSTSGCGFLRATDFFGV